MTAPGTNGGGLAGEMEAVKRAFDADVAAERQLSMLDPVSAEEMVEAREELGGEAGVLSVLRHARERRAGRPPGARNKRTDDFAKLLSSHGPDPIIGAYRLANTPPEVLIEASKQEKVHSFDKHNVPRIVIERMTYSDALAHIARARELVAPYLHGKKPVVVSYDFSGLKDLMIEGITHSGEELADIIEADFVAIEEQSDGGDDGD
jgi:hypothetical protein